MVFRRKQDVSPIEVTSVEEGVLGDVVQQEIESDIYVMPQEYYDPLTQEKKGSKTYIIVGIIVVILMAFGGAYAYVFYFQNFTSTDEILDSNSIINPFLDATDETTNNIDALEDLTGSTSTDLLDSEVVGDDSMEKEDGDSKESFMFFENLPNVFDSDNDGLTEVEETLLGTNVNIVDSDGDSFSDGAELQSGYDPSIPEKTLRDSALFQTYINETEPAFSIDLPQSWILADSEDASLRMFTAPNGDVVTIELFQNSAPFTFGQWFATHYPDTNQTRFTQNTYGDFSGLVSPTERRVIINTNTHIIVLTYDVGTKLEIAYPNVWAYSLHTLSRVQ